MLVSCLQEQQVRDAPGLQTTLGLQRHQYHRNSSLAVRPPRDRGASCVTAKTTVRPTSQGQRLCRDVHLTSHGPSSLKENSKHKSDPRRI